MSAETGQPSSLRIIEGCVPGLLDTSQTTRLLHDRGSRLSFASFNPHTASIDRYTSDIHRLSLKEELWRPKRVVIETTPSGESFWRFVPKAQFENDVQDEGAWPRVVDICGQHVLCSQEQWEIYKLDPAYTCTVASPPTLSCIKPTDRPIDVPVASTSQVPSTGASPQKRRLQSPSAPSPRGRFANHSPKKTRTVPVFAGSDDDSESSSDEDDEGEVEAMVVDSSGNFRARSATATKRFEERRRAKETSRAARREKVAKAKAKQMEGGGQPQHAERPPLFDFSHSRQNVNPFPPAPKRKVSSTFFPSQSAGPSGAVDDRIESPIPTKRSRARSPNSTRAELATKREARERQRKELLDARLNGWRETRHQEFMKDILADVPEEVTNGSHPTSSLDDDGDHADDPDGNEKAGGEWSGDVRDEEAARREAIEISRRKLAELERDKPLWEQAAKRRAMNEQAEVSAARAAAEKAHHAAEQRAKAEQLQQALEREREEAEREARRQAEQEAARRETEMRRRQQQQERWSRGPWTHQRALERYRTLCDAFDATKFSPSDPLCFELVPWPVLLSPMRLSVEDIQWDSVEAFFAAIKPSMRTQDFKVFVEKSQRRFHPDRWRGRGLLASINDEQERASMEVAANMVAQAVTPLWRSLKGP